MIEIGTYSRSYLGERHNGDQLFLNERDQKTFVAIIDGLGHGEAAEKMALLIKKFIGELLELSISDILNELHHKSKGQLGAVIGIGILENHQFTYGGIGNINCRIIGKRSRIFTNTDGVIGLRKGTVKEQSEILDKDDIILLSSDGLSHRVPKEEVLRLNYLNVNAMAKRIVDSFGSNFDDASVVIIRNKYD